MYDLYVNLYVTIKIQYEINIGKSSLWLYHKIWHKKTGNLIRHSLNLHTSDGKLKKYKG